MFTKLLSTNESIRKITGVQNFHDEGYYGERVIAANGECWDLNSYNPDGLGSNPIGYTSFSDHGLKAAACFFQVAPLAHLVMFSASGRFKSDGTYESEIMENALPYIKNNNITAMFTSLSTAGNLNFRNDYDKEMETIPNFCSCWSAGNDGEGNYGRMLELKNVIGVGGFSLNGENPVVTIDSGSSDKDYVIDFCAPFNIHCQLQNGADIRFSGTSASAPWLCGMICLVNDFFIDKTGKPLTREKMIQFLKDYSIDIDIEGVDKRSGWGIPCLPKPSEIDIKKYSSETSPDVNEPVYEGVADWAKEAWEKGAKKGIIDGTRPTDNITRQEMVVILDRLKLFD